MLTNFLSVLKNWYGIGWGHKDNVFLSAAGFTGAMDFFKNKLIAYCNLNRNYKLEFMSAAMKLDKDPVLKRSDLKGLQGRNAARQVTETLTASFSPSGVPQGEIEY